MLRGAGKALTIEEIVESIAWKGRAGDRAGRVRDLLDALVITGAAQNSGDRWWSTR